MRRSAISARGRPPAGRRFATADLPVLRRSILLRVLAALLVALIVSIVVTVFVQARLTRATLARQARAHVTAHLGILQEAYVMRTRDLNAALRNLAQVLGARDLVAPERRNSLIAELALARRNFELALLEVVDRDDPSGPPRGRSVGGLTLAVPPPVPVEAAGADYPSTLLPTEQGVFVQTVTMPIGAPGDRFVLVGGREFADGFARDLRGQIGEADHVVLVARGEVAGSTMADPPSAPPGASARGLSREPVAARLGGVETLVAYHAITDPKSGEEIGAIGVALPDPAADVDRSLARTRLITAAILAAVALLCAWILFRPVTRPLVNLAHTAERIAGGDLEASFDGSGGDEIGRLGGALERMRVELQTKLQLVADQALGLQESSKRIVAAQDEERHRLARDLHDGLQQQLVVLRIGLGMAKETAQRAPERARDLFDGLGEELDRIIQQLREVSQDLYPSILLDRGLAAAVRSYAGRLTVSTKLTCSPDPLPRLQPEMESSAYFLLCEAVTNALKHSGASRIEIEVALRDETWLVVSVTDDGRGFHLRKTPRRGGLLHMEDRARSLGGELAISSLPGKGTRVIAAFPVAAQALSEAQARPGVNAPWEAPPAAGSRSGARAPM